MTETLGKSVLELEANLTPFRKGVRSAKGDADELRGALEALAAVANISEKELNRLGLHRSAAVESDVSAEVIIRGVKGIGEESRRAARDLDDVKLDTANAAETTAAGDAIDRKLKQITGNANETRRSLESVNLASAGAGGGGGRGIGLLGAAIGGGTLLGPAAGPGALGLLAAIPVLATSGAGALGTLALAFQGVGKAIGGDKKAFDDLGKSAQGFVLTVRSLDGWFDKLKETAAGSLFPGLTEGLKSALSPGTLTAVTTAVTTFGHAIGEAGAAWGKYFGSAEFQNIFGSLMQAGARNFSLFSDAALRLFDALGVLARAAIPLTQWMVEGINSAAGWADAFLHAKDATGALGGAMSEAKTSLQIVGNLFAALGRAVFELGAALYPVSKVAVKDLTDGLNFLAGVFDRNKQTIRDIVSGALAALVATLQAAWPIAAKIAEALNSVATAIGGWKVAFEIVIGGMLAVKLANVAIAISNIGVAAGEATSLTGILRGALLGLGAPEVLAALAAAAAAYGLYQSVTTQTYPGVKPAGDGSYTYTRDGQTYRVYPGGKPGRGYTVSKSDPRDGMRGADAPHGGTTGYYQSEAAQFATQYGVPAALFTAQINQESGFNPNAVSSAGAKGIAQFMPGTAKGLGVNPDDPTSSLSGAAKLMASYYKKYGRWDFALAAYNGGPGAVDYYVKHGYFPTSETTNYVSSILGAAGIPGGAEPGAAGSPFGAQPAFTKNLGPKSTSPTGAALLPQSLRDALQKAKDNATTSQGSTAGHWLQIELADLEKAKKELAAELKKPGQSAKQVAAIKAEARSIDGEIASVSRQITVNLHAQAQAVKTAFASKISEAKSNITSAVGLLKQTLDDQLQAKLQTYITDVLGPQFFQGTDAHGMPLQTPAEAKLAAEQAADTLKSLQDAITAAADPTARAAAQHQLDEYNDSIAATKERAQADYDYAQAVKKAQADEAEQQRELNNQLDTFSKGLAAGTSNLSDLGGIVGGFGLSLTADGGIVDDLGTLANAVKALSDIMFAKSVALGGVGDTSDAHKAALAAAGLVIPAGSPTLIPGTKINFAEFYAASQLKNAEMPKLDVGGWVEQTGMAIVHRGETYSGVGSDRMGGGVSLTVQAKTVIGGDLDQVARDLKPYLDRVIQLR